LSKLEEYIEQLFRFSKRYNLVGFKDSETFAERGIIDSLLFLEFIPEASKMVLDVGSGAGLPGVIIKIARPELTTTLIEPARKKAAFLNFVINRVRLTNINVYQQSIENFVKTSQVQYDIIITRALFTAEQLVKKTMPITAVHTRFILSKGPKIYKELLQLEKKGLQWKIYKRKLPFSGIERFFLVIESAAGNISNE